MSSIRTMSGVTRCRASTIDVRPSTKPATWNPAVWRSARRMLWMTSEWSAMMSKRFMATSRGLRLTGGPGLGLGPRLRLADGGARDAAEVHDGHGGGDGLVV